MSKEDEIICSNCGARSDQSLMLSCDHNLCMNCAAENLVRHESPGINKTQYVICDICQTKTEIDTNTSKEVLSLGLNNLNKINNNINNLNNINQTSNNIYPNIDTNNSLPDNLLNYNTFNTTNTMMNSNNIMSSNPVNLIYFDNNSNNNIYSKLNVEIKDNVRSNICNDHGEPITYLCLDCMSKCICAECVVHGIHRNHEVLNIYF